MDHHHLATYPRFAPNQVLTDGQLNGLHRFLDEQNRLTRTHGIGAGILCGLQAEYLYGAACDEHYLVLTPGYGFSSEGYLIEIAPGDAPEPGKEIPRAGGAEKKPCVDLPAGKIIYTHVRKYAGSEAGLSKEEAAAYDPWWNCATEVANAPIPVGSRGKAMQMSTARKVQQQAVVSAMSAWELLTPDDGIMAGKEATELHELHVTDHVLVLFLEKGYAENKPCVETDCTKNDEVVYHIRPLLVPASCYQKMQVCKSVPLLQVPRLHRYAPTQTGSTDAKNGGRIAAVTDSLLPGGIITNFTDYQSINTAYGKLVEDLVGDIWKHLAMAYKRHAAFLYLEEEVDIAEMERLLKGYIQSNRFDIDYHQYHYDFLKDLATGYNEFISEACKLTGCWPVDGFPRHLGVTMFTQPKDQVIIKRDKGYRTTFTPSAVRNVSHGDWDRVRNLFLRIRDMICYFDFHYELTEFATDAHRNRFPIRVTPSKKELLPLGRRAIPYYYDIESQEALTAFMQNWQPSDCCTGEVLLGYAFQGEELQKKYAEQTGETFHPIQTDPLAYSVLSHDFYRIEGHIGMSCDTAEASIKKLRLEHNLEFDFRVIRLNDPNNRLPFFQDLGPAVGLEHMAGVPIGGTFIMLCDEICIGKNPNGGDIMAEIVVADFALHQSVACCGDREATGDNKESTLTQAMVPPSETATLSSRSVISSEAAPAAAASSLTARSQKYYQELFNLNASGDFQGNVTYEEALDFIQTRMPFSEALESYDSLASKLIRVYKQTKKADKKQAYKQILERVTHKVLDLTVNAGSLATGTLDTLESQLAAIKEAGIAPAKILTNWKAQELGKSSTVTSLQQLLKS